MANDSKLFRTRDNLEAEGAELRTNIFIRGDRGDDRWLPLYEAKMIHHFDHRFGDYALARISDKEVRQLPQAAAERLADPTYAVLPRYWVGRDAVEDRLRERWPCSWLLGWRDICSSVDVRTVIASVVPRVGVNHKFPLMFPAGPPRNVACLLACLNSFPFDYCARQKLGGTSLTYFVVKQLPVLPPSVFECPASWSATELLRDWLVPRVLELTYTAWDLQPFAQDCGWTGPPFRWDEDRRFLLRCELDAAFLHLYLAAEKSGGWRPAEGETAEDLARLNASFPAPRDAVAYIMDAFPIVRRKDEEKCGGDYRTKHVILDVYDAMAKAIATGETYQTVLDPPPADPRVAHPDMHR